MTARAGLHADAVLLRRELHAHPELRFEEHRTAQTIADRLTALGLEVTRGVGGTGVIGLWSSGSPGGTVVVRADLDALPVPDAKGVQYRSTRAGVTHACGHDVHMAVVAGVAQAIAQTPPAAGRVAFLFQPAEEIPFGGASGGRAVLESGEFDALDADTVLGLHCWPSLPAGTIGVDTRIAMAAKDAFSITVNGRGAHAATPATGIDAVLVAAQLIQALHHLIARRVDPDDSAVLNVGTIEGGHSQSVLADRVTMTGTIRTVEPATRTMLRGAIDDTVAGFSTAHRTAIDLTWANEMPAVVNDPELVDLALSSLGDAVRIERPPMTTDDFALYAERVPGLYVKLGVAAPEDTSAAPLHSSHFDVDERAIGVGIDALELLVRARLAYSLTE